MIFEKINVLLPDYSIGKDLFVVITDGKIAYIGKSLPEAYPIQAHRRVSGHGKLLMSGFFNLHSHSPMTLLRGYGEGLPLQEWLTKRVFPFEAKMTEEDIYNGCLLACAEMLRGGTVAFSDMYYYGAALSEAVVQSGMKANISLAVTNLDGQHIQDKPIFREMLGLPATNGNVTLDYSIHAEYTSDPETVRAVAQAAKERGLRLHIHLSETKSEHEGCKARYGKTPAEYFYENNAFDVPVIAAHGVWLEESDIALLAENGAVIAVNPSSNMKLASGFCNLPLIIKHNLSYGLGTDGAASNNTLDMLHEMRLLATIYKCAYSDPTLITAEEAVRAATRAGAAAQCRNSGLIQVGMDADLIVINLDNERFYPAHDILTGLVYNTYSSDVVLTMVNGKVLYENGEFKTLDIEKVKYNANKSAERILCQL